MTVKLVKKPQNRLPQTELETHYHEANQELDDAFDVLAGEGLER